MKSSSRLLRIYWQTSGIPPRQNNMSRRKKDSSFSGKNSNSEKTLYIPDLSAGTYALMRPTCTMRWFFGLASSSKNHSPHQHHHHASSHPEALMRSSMTFRAWRMR
jgi:hypothetical protein